MKKLFRLICLAAILCVAYLMLTTPRGGVEPAMKTIDAEADGNPDQVKEISENAIKQADEFIGDAVKKADEVLEDAVAQADQAIADAVDSAAEGAKQGFLESLKDSAHDFWENLFSKDQE